MATTDARPKSTAEISRLAAWDPRRAAIPRRHAGTGAAFAFLDFCVALAAGIAGYATRAVVAQWLGLPALDLQSLPHLQLLGFLLCYAIFTVVCNAAQDLYSDEVLHAGFVNRRRILKAFLLSALLAVMVVFVSGEKDVPRLIVASTLVLNLAGMTAVRYVIRRHYLKRLARGIGTRHVLVVGTGPVAEAFRRYLESNRHFGKVFCGFVDRRADSSPEWLGAPEDLLRILRENFIDEIYIAPGVSRELVMEIVLDAREQQIGVGILPELYDGMAAGAAMNRVGPFPVLELNRQPIPALGILLKRIMDVMIALGALTVTAPLMVAAAIAIRLDSPGPVLYKAWRVGRKGRKFLCYKFRTMVEDADAHKEKLRHMNERNGATFKITNDPRITPVGRILRKYSVDELPQLFNVLKGEMSIVGPRPHPVDDYNQYSLEDLRRLDVLPGITGLWQVCARHDPSFEKNVLLDLEYIQNWNIWLDVKILLKTVPEVCGGTGR